MADKPITELIEASQVTGTDSFVLEQNGTAKRLTGQTLINYLLKMIDGHGGVSGVAKVSTSGLVDIYRMNFADLTTFDFCVTNGRAITSVEETSNNGLTRTYTIGFNDGTSQTFTVTDGRSIIKTEKTSTNGLVDTYTITFNDGSTNTFNVTNGAKGDKGDNTYLWIKYASQEPTESSHSIGDLPDSWIGIYYGPVSTAPEDWKQYSWFKIKGEKGDTGNPATLVSAAVTYQVSDSGNIIPSGTWGTSIPVVAQGKYLWTKIVQTFNTGNPVTAYTVSRMGLDGLGSVVSVCGISPDENGNVPLTAAAVGALPSAGGDMTGPINMNGKALTGLNAPEKDSDAANRGYVDGAVKSARPFNILDNSDFRNPVNQRGAATYNAGGYYIDRWEAMMWSTPYPTLTVDSDGIHLSGGYDGPNTCLIAQKVAANGLGGKTLTAAVKYKSFTVTNESTRSLTVYCDNVRLGLARVVNSVKNLLLTTFVVPEGAKVIQFNIGNSANDAGTGEYDAVLEWAALYEGEYTAETLPEYQPKGYGVELAACERYYRKFVSPCIPWANNANGTTISGFLPIEMRIAPTVIFDSLYVFYGNNTYATITVGGAEKHTSGIKLNFTADSVISANGHGIISGTSLILSADL